MTKIEKIERTILMGAMALAILARFWTLDLPETGWRQSTTAYMAYRMAQESPPDLLHPKVPYRGDKDVRVSELPIYPYLVALVYKAMGTPECVPAARLVSLLFYLGAAYYLFLLVRMLIGVRIALYSAFVYLILPLGFYYSREIHYDVMLIFFCHAFFYYGLRFFESRRWGYFVASTLAGTVAFLMKPPYCFYFGLPLAAWALYPREQNRIKTLFLLAALFVLPLLAAWGFNEYRVALEGTTQQSFVFAQKWTNESEVHHFFGRWEERIDPEKWRILLRWVVFTVFTPLGLVAALLFFIRRWESVSARSHCTLWAFFAGIGLYLLLMFHMMASGHDYYSLPLLFPAAVIWGVFLDALATAFGERAASWPGLGRMLVVVSVLVASAFWIMSYFGYLTADWQVVEVGRVIREKTDPDDLVLSIAKGRWTGATDSRTLYQAKRRGWAIWFDDLTRENLESYKQAGARFATLVIPTDFETKEPVPDYLAVHETDQSDVKNPAGQKIATLYFLDLASAPSNQKTTP